MVDSRIEQAIANGTVPSDITAEYLSETRDRPSIIGIVFVTALTFIIVCTRLISRSCVVRRVGIDDALAALSLALLICFVGLSIELINLGSGRHFAYIEYVMDVPTVLQTQVLDFVAHIIYTTALLLCRVSGLAFYWRVCALHNNFLLAIKIVFGILVAGFLPQIFLLIFHCTPVTGYWPYGWEPVAPRYTCLQWGLVYSVNSSVSLLCDLLIFGIPIAMLRTLEMSRKRKIQLAGILLPGVAVIAISITRLVLVILGQWETDESWSYDPMLGVEASEIGATLIALSVPGAKPLVDRYIFRKDDTQTSGASHYGHKTNSFRTRGTALSTLRFQSSNSQHSILGSQEDEGPKYGSEAVATAGNRHTDDAEGIYVQVDFDVKEARVHSNTSASLNSR
ncbi:hypothetical protein TARUN_1146 [Trichoderma arundinaceum]|uniref:Rhodopsin domain-containing protein n=1 Tax=Trichoderma arundinaceum TaxID=490622 RepID=A0A395NYF8_TRIAR|nr:hypothetical protein TARUN_1146 [Trichoderma arundinaceum]